MNMKKTARKGRAAPKSGAVRRSDEAAGPQRAREARMRMMERLPDRPRAAEPDADAVIECGWGRIIFAQTFDDMSAVVETLRQEEPDDRDIAFYVNDPHVALAEAPHQIFLDPSHTYRLWLSHYRSRRTPAQGFTVRRLSSRYDIEAINDIYSRLGMVQIASDFLLKNKSSRRFVFLVAENVATGAIVGTAMGVDHHFTFNDPDQGSSLWCLAVDPQSSIPGIGQELVRHLAETFQTRGRAFMDLSVMHDNKQAIALYEKIGFERINAFSLKHKNPINEKLFMGPQPDAKLNPYAQIIINEARRRGIDIRIEDAAGGFFVLSQGRRTIHCRESLSDLTSAVALSRCDDKAVTRRLLAAAELNVPHQVEYDDEDQARDFLEKHGRIVVKPARGEQGAGISVDISRADEMVHAVGNAKRVCDRVLLESFHEGQDLRIIVIDDKVVAGAIRRPAAVVGNGQSTIEDLIRAQSRRRAAATGGESVIPVDDETRRCIALAGYEMAAILPKGERLAVRKTANLHTGGTIHDVTGILHRTLVAAAVDAAQALKIPVVGLDFLVVAPDSPDYVIIEANERPGLANHEPQPTAERFIDLLFPQTKVGP